MNRECKKHGFVKFYKIKGDYYKCSKCRSEAVQRRRDKLKQMSVEYKGGCCANCGYSRCIKALEFHHIDESKKDFGISHKGYTRSWERVKLELDKCIILCANCHREIHEGLLDIAGLVSHKMCR